MPKIDLDRMAAVGGASRFERASTTGLTLEVVTGMDVRSKSRTDRGEYEIGGVVLEVIEGASFFDAEGERVEIPATVVVFDGGAPPGKQWHRLAEPDIDLKSVHPAYELGSLSRRMAFAYGKPNKRGHFPNLHSSHDLDVLRYLGALGKVLGANSNAVVVERATRRRTDDDTF